MINEPQHENRITFSHESISEITKFLGLTLLFLPIACLIGKFSSNKKSTRILYALVVELLGVSISIGATNESEEVQANTLGVIMGMFFSVPLHLFKVALSSDGEIKTLNSLVEGASLGIIPGVALAQVWKQITKKMKDSGMGRKFSTLSGGGLGIISALVIMVLEELLLSKLKSCITKNTSDKVSDTDHSALELSANCNNDTSDLEKNVPTAISDNDSLSSSLATQAVHNLAIENSPEKYSFKKVIIESTVIEIHNVK